jgi:hypothetical protein
MALRIHEHLKERAIDPQQQRAVWDFVARVEDWRCTVCFKRVDYDDHESFERTRLCPACCSAVNDTAGWSPVAET